MDADRAHRAEDALTRTTVRPPTGPVLTDLWEPGAGPDRGRFPLGVPETPIVGLGPEWLPVLPEGAPRGAFPDQPERGRTGRWRLGLAYGLMVVYWLWRSPWGSGPGAGSTAPTPS
jgi:hypothetical protein